jgi:hypothetical protein
MHMTNNTTTNVIISLVEMEEEEEESCASAALVESCAWVGWVGCFVGKLVSLEKLGVCELGWAVLPGRMGADVTGSGVVGCCVVGRCVLGRLLGRMDGSVVTG